MKRGRRASQAMYVAGSNGAPPGAPLFRRLLVGLLLFVGTIVAYLPTIQGGFIWDDDAYVQKNTVLLTGAGLRDIWLKPSATPQYYPLVYTSYWIEYHLWAQNSAGYHATNIVLHALGSLLLWRLLAHLELPGAAWVAALFAVHPVHVESVAWITERKNVLSGAFYFAAFWAYLRFALPLRRRPPLLWRTVCLYSLSLALFACALLSKTVTCSLPAAVLLVLWWKRGRLAWRDLGLLSPFLAMGAVMGLVTAHLEVVHVGASGSEWSLTILERTLLAGRILWFYIAKLVWPAELMFFYPKWTIDTSAAWQYLFSIAFAGGVAGLWWFRRSIGRGPLVSVLFFAGTLFPALGFFNVYPMRYSYVADHFQYLASAGVIALAVAAVLSLACRFGRGGRIGVSVLGLGALALLGSVTWRQGEKYTDVEVLWRDTIQKNPDAWMARNNLGNILVKLGRPEEAIRQYEQALRVKPDEASIYHNCAGALLLLNRFEEAIEYEQVSVRLNPRYVEAQCTLAIALGLRNDVRGAMEHYRIALRLVPEDVQAMACLAWILATHPDPAIFRPDEAVVLAERAAQLTKLANPNVLDTLGAAYASNGQYEQAVQAALRARAMVARSGPAEFADAIQSRLKLYQQGRPFRGWTAAEGNMGGFLMPASRPSSP